MRDEPSAATVPRVLVVCAGNLCRSPLAAALLHRELAGDGVAADVSSAGLAAPPGMSPDRNVLRVAGEHGVDLEAHVSTLVSRDDLRGADLILTMTGEQAGEVRAIEPSAAARTIPLRAAAWRARVIGGRPAPFAEWVARLAGDSRGLAPVRPEPANDVADPTGGPLGGYRAMGDEVASLVGVLVERWSGR